MCSSQELTPAPGGDEGPGTRSGPLCRESPRAPLPAAGTARGDDHCPVAPTSFGAAPARQFVSEDPGDEAVEERNRTRADTAFHLWLMQRPARELGAVFTVPDGTPPLERPGAPLSPTLSFHSEVGSPTPACHDSPEGRWVSPGDSRMLCSPTLTWKSQSPDAGNSGKPPADGNHEPVSVQIRMPDGRFVSAQIRALDSVRTLRSFLAERTGIPWPHLTLALHSRTLREDTPLLAQGVGEASCLSVAVRLFGGGGEDSGPSPRRRRHPKRAADSNASPPHTVPRNREARSAAATGAGNGPDASSISADLQELSLGEAEHRAPGGQRPDLRAEPEPLEEALGTPLPTPAEAPIALGPQLHRATAQDNMDVDSEPRSGLPTGMEVDAEATPPGPLAQTTRPGARGPRPPPPPVPQAGPPASEPQIRRRPTAALARMEALRCRLCPVPATAHLARDGRGLVQHMVTMHMGEPLSLEAIRQLRGLDKAACRMCARIRAQATSFCAHCGCSTGSRPLILGDVVPDRRRTAAPAAAADNLPAAATQHGSAAVAASATAPVPGPSAQDSDTEPTGPQPAPRAALLSPETIADLPHLGRSSILHIPRSIAHRIADTWSEALEGCLQGDTNWAILARYRCRMLLAPVPEALDRNTELKRRLQFWCEGHFDALTQHVLLQQAKVGTQKEPEGGAQPTADAVDPKATERRAKAVRHKVAAGAIGKAVQSLLGGVADLTADERASWTRELIPRSSDAARAPIGPYETSAAMAHAWGGGDPDAARSELRQAGKRPGGPPKLPWAHLSPLTAPGPSGERQEHLDDVLDAAGPRQRRRLVRALDTLAVLWAVNRLPPTCAWLLNTQILFLRKDREPRDKTFDDEAWIASLAKEWEDEGPTEPEADELHASPESSTRPAAPPKPRPIQQGEFLRKWTAKRLMAANHADIARVMAAMRQIGVGLPGGAEALAIFHKLLYKSWTAGRLPQALARVKVDLTNCFGNLEWWAIRNAAQEELPRHHAVAGSKHSNPSYVEQASVPPHLKDRGAEQGDVDGPLECGITAAQALKRTRRRLHEAQCQGLLPWTGSPQDPTVGQQAVADFESRKRRGGEWSALPPHRRREAEGAGPIIPDPSHEVQRHGGVVDWDYLDDDDFLIAPPLVPTLLRIIDEEMAFIGAARNRAKTEVIYFASAEALAEHGVAWELEFIKTQAAVSLADEGTLTLGVAIGPDLVVATQVDQKAQVVRAVHQRAEVCSDAQTEHVISRQSLGVCRVNHILRVHGHDLLGVGDSLQQFDSAAALAMDRLFPGTTAEGLRQAALAAPKGGLGWRWAADVARPANLAAVLAAGPLIRAMARDASFAGLIPHGLIEDGLEEATRVMAVAFCEGLHEKERARAEGFLIRAEHAARRQWAAIQKGHGWLATASPDVDVSYDADNELAAAAPSDQDGDPPESQALTSARLQKALCALADCTRLRQLEHTLEQQGQWSQLARLRELRHPQVSHQWLWHLDPAKGAVLTEVDYVTCVQKRIGARVVDCGDDVPLCRLCEAPLDPQAEHCETCATAEATRGHYACVRAFMDGLRPADSAATTEPRGLTDNLSRPADILTNAAAPGRSTALDVMVTSPNRASAGGDAAQAAFAWKCGKYRGVLPQLREAGISFRPLIWTADGRPHPAVTRTMRYAAERAVARGGRTTTVEAYLRRWDHEISIAILRRRAAMTRAVLPQLAPAARRFVTGERVDEDARLPILEADSEGSGGVEPTWAASPPPQRATLGGA